MLQCKVGFKGNMLARERRDHFEYKVELIKSHLTQYRESKQNRERESDREREKMLK